MKLQENIQRIKEMMGIISEEESDDILKKEFEQSYKFNSEVEKLQKKLTEKGYYIGNFGPNKDGIDGKYGPFTQAAHLAFTQNVSPKEFDQQREKMAQKFIGDVKDDVLKNEFNFHKIPDDNNNYRSAQIPVSINGKDYLGTVIEKYNIKTVIRLNGDGVDSRHRSSHPMTPISSEKEVVESKGAKFYKLSSTKDQDKVNSLLSQGNVLIHCAHGADRTGGNVGGYLYKKGLSTKDIWDYTTKYNSWESMIKNNPTGFETGGYLRQAKKFGVKDIDHAKELSNIK
jgi:hypothetical protein